MGKKVGGVNYIFLIGIALALFAMFTTCSKRGPAPMFRWSKAPVQIEETSAG